jgi:DNA-binding response OmpR family regulator
MVGGIQEDEYGFRWSKDYAQGLQCLEESPWDLCLVDYNLGDRSGIDLLHEAQRRRLESCFVLLTGCGSRELDLRAMYAGAAAYLEKDWLQPQSLERTLRYALTNRAGRGMSVARPSSGAGMWRIPPAAASLIRSAFLSGSGCALAPMVLNRAEALSQQMNAGLAEVVRRIAAHLRERLTVSDLLFELDGPGLLLMSTGMHAADARAYFSLVLGERLSSFSCREMPSAPLSARWTTLSSEGHPAPESLFAEVQRFFAEGERSSSRTSL